MTGYFGDQRAITPVVGGVLLVAIVLLLSVVTVGMVLNLNQEQEPAPEVAMSLEPVETSSEEYRLVHKSGDRLNGDKVELLGVEDPDSMKGSTLNAGDRHNLVPTEETVRVIYHGEHGNSYTLYEFSVDISSDDSGLSLPSADEGCSWVSTESGDGTDPVKVDGLVVDCDVTTDDPIEVLSGGAIIGDTQSNNKDLDLDDGTVYGDVAADDVVNVQNGAVYGTVVSNTSDVKIDNSSVSESIEGEKVVEVINGGTVDGDAVSTTKPVKILSGSTVEGDITSGDSVKLTDATVKGDVYIDPEDFDCSNSTIDGQNCGSYSPKDPSNY